MRRRRDCPSPSQRRGIGGGFAVWLAVTFTSVGTALAIAATGSADGGRTGETVLHGAVWRADALGEHIAGAACWFRGEAGELRVDVMRYRESTVAVSPSWPDLFHRIGEGWTVCNLADGTALRQRWGDRFESLEPLLREQLVQVLSVIESGPERAVAAVSPLAVAVDAGSPRPLWVARPRLRRQVTSSERTQGEGVRPGRLIWLADGALRRGGWRAPHGLRGELSHRGWGRGSPSEIWTLVWQACTNCGEGHELRLTSSRRPGCLVLSPLAVSPRVPLLDDAFLPIWSVGEVVELPAEWPVLPAVP